MSLRLYSIEIRGRVKRWSFDIYAEPAWVDDWTADGLEIAEVLNRWPEWLPGWAVRPWCFCQDVLNLRNPWQGW